MGGVHEQVWLWVEYMSRYGYGRNTILVISSFKMWLQKLKMLWSDCDIAKKFSTINVWPKRTRPTAKAESTSSSVNI